nr:sugar phosphate isomerase/epimerase [uncultured Methanospirillum sp.]
MITENNRFEVANEEVFPKNSIYVSTSCLPGVDSLTERISLFQKNGFDAIELGAGVRMNKKDHQFLLKNKNKFLLHNYFPPPLKPFVLNLASENADIQKKSLKLIRTALKLSKDLQSPFYTIHAGFVKDPTEFRGNNYIFPSYVSNEEIHYASIRYAKLISQIAKESKLLNIDLYLENNCCTVDLVNKLLLQTQNEFASLFQSNRIDNLGILLDTGHLNVTAQTYGFDPRDFVKDLQGHIKVIHLHDNDGILDLHKPINSDSWFFDVIQKPAIAELPIIIEAKFKDVYELQKHVQWLKSELGRE